MLTRALANKLRWGMRLCNTQANVKNVNRLPIPMPSINLAPVNIIHIAYVTLALFSIFLIIGKTQYKVLALLLAIHLVQEFLNPLEELGITSYLLTPAFQLAFGPLYYLLVKNLIYGELHIRQHLLHFLPTVIALTLTRWWPIELMVAFIILVIYMVASFRLILRYHRVLKETLSDGENHSLIWLTRTFSVIFLIELIDFTRLNLQQTLSYEILVNWYFVSTLVSLLCTAYLVIKAVRQPVLYDGISRLETSLDTSLISVEKDLDLAKNIFAAIELHQHETSAYRQPKYSLRNLADDMQLTEQNVSWALNRGGEKSFSDFINELRLEEVKQLLKQNKNTKNVLDIAFAAGFSSKSTFNAVFKKSTGMTPSQYLQQD